MAGQNESADLESKTRSLPYDQPFRSKKEDLPMIRNRQRILFLLTITTVSLAAAIGARADEPLKIFILAGQSNTVGHARGHTIATLFASDKARDKGLTQMIFGKESSVSKQMLDEQLEEAKKLDELTGGINNEKIKALEGAEKEALQAKAKKLKEAHEAYKSKVISKCIVSDRVYINSIADRNKKSGKLGVGYGADAKKIGPEYGFGLSMAKKIEGPILLIKTSWGGKSLNYNFRPPSAGEYQLNDKQKKGGKADEIKEKAGLFYRMMTDQVNDVLNNLEKNHPAYDKEAGYKIEGFVWFQGYNDQFSPEFRDNYKDNMVTFIKDVRKEFKAPGMPFVIGVLGTGMTAEKVGENAVSVGQREAAKASEFKGNVVSVESYTEYSHYSYNVFKKGWPKHYHEWDTVGSDRPYHYLGSGAFFVRLGDSFANAMADLMAKQKK